MSVFERPGRAVQVMVPRSKCDELVERSNNGRENREEEGGPKRNDIFESFGFRTGPKRKGVVLKGNWLKSRDMI